MIQVQIASTLDAAGVTGVRWVLIDPSEAVATPSVAPMQRAEPAAPQPSLPGTRVKRTSLTLHVISAALLLGALVGAWWAASLMLESRGATTPQAAATQARPS
ncbi:hypothetical protein [Aquabacterium sp.]|uniref:hypothetical protein n=1 Tax=Aquabacterium sp. TaxID=1872578 RepID=UPI002CE8AAA7|nr:hypothetical protein [Aquabacterium sp.]HSW05570.1 hypothetical protein [Aquabacterium sp.]